MTSNSILVYLLIYMPPILALFGLACIVYTQHPTRLDNRLVSIICLLYSFLFFEEFIRHLLPISWSAAIVTFLFGNIGLLVISVMTHLLIHLSRLRNQVRIPFYPYIFYIPVLLIVYSVVFSKPLIRNSEFIQQGIWYAPVFNMQYYLTLTLSNLAFLFLIGILWNSMKQERLVVRRKFLRFLLLGTFLTLVTNIILGYFDFKGFLPPYSYLIVGILFSTVLSISVLRYQFLPSSAKKYQTMFDLSPVSISVVTQDWEILETNRCAKKELKGYNQIGSTLLDFVSSDSNRLQLVQLGELLKEKGTIRNHSVTFEVTGTEEQLNYSVDGSLVGIEDKMIFYLIWRDVTDLLRNERLIQHMAYYDALTGLHNRAYFVSTISDQLEKLAKRPKERAALILMDLNSFKEINDTFGHAVGDQVLQHTALLLKESVRKNDTIARLGGDEFIVFLDNLSSNDEAYAWVKRVRHSLKNNPFMDGEIFIEVNASLGIAFFPSDATNFEGLFQSADFKMYEEKAEIKKQM